MKIPLLIPMFNLAEIRLTLLLPPTCFFFQIVVAIKTPANTASGAVDKTVIKTIAF